MNERVEDVFDAVIMVSSVVAMPSSKAMKSGAFPIQQ